MDGRHRQIQCKRFPSVAVGRFGRRLACAVKDFFGFLKEYAMGVVDENGF